MKGDEPGTFKANEKYKDVPGVVLRFGNLPAMMGASVHSGEDVILTATGPGSERVHGLDGQYGSLPRHGGRARPCHRGAIASRLRSLRVRKATARQTSA